MFMESLLLVEYRVCQFDYSDVTVMRACRTAGYDGFQDLKYHVLREYTSCKAPAIPSGSGTYGTDVSESLEAAEASLDRAAQIIHRARRVALVGVPPTESQSSPSTSCSPWHARP